MNRLIVLSGVPGSGKSYFSAALKRAIKKHVYIVSSDELRYNILGNQQDLSEDELVWKIYYSLVEAYSIDKNGIVILDATHSKKVYRLDNITMMGIAETPINAQLFVLINMFSLFCVHGKINIC